MINYNTHGITAEDLEKAASVRLFEKAAAAEGINLAELTEDQVEDLYSAYTSQENDMDLIDLFEKQASVEGVDLDMLSDEELQGAYANFVAAVEAEQEQEEEELTYDDVNEYLTDRQDEVIELMKEAGVMDKVKGAGSAYMSAAKGQAGRLKQVGAIGGTAAGLAALGYGGKKLMDKRKAKKAMEKQAGEDMLLNVFDEEVQNAYGVSAADLSDEEFAGLYDEFLTNVSDNIVHEYHAEEEAAEKLAEAEILGRHMAQAFNDELEKEAMAVVPTAAAKKGMSRMAKGGLAAAGTLAAGYGAKKLYDKRKKKKAMKKEAADEVLMDWFEKQAEYEGIDLDEYNDEEVDYMFDNFLNMFTEEDEILFEKEAASKADMEADKINKDSVGGFRGAMGGAMGGMMSGGGRGAVRGGLLGGAIGAARGATTSGGSLKSRLAGAARGGLAGAKGGALAGGSLGASIGAARGSLQGNQAGNKAKKKGHSAVAGGFRAGFRGGSPIGKGTRKLLDKRKKK